MGIEHDTLWWGKIWKTYTETIVRSQVVRSHHWDPIWDLTNFMPKLDTNGPSCSDWCCGIWFDCGTCSFLRWKNVVENMKMDDVQFPSWITRDHGVFKRTGKWGQRFPCRPYGSRFAESSSWQIRWLYLLEGLSQRCDCGPGLSFLFWNVPIHAYSLGFIQYVCIGWYWWMSKSFELWGSCWYSYEWMISLDLWESLLSADYVSSIYNHIIYCNFCIIYIYMYMLIYIYTYNIYYPCFILFPYSAFHAA